MRPLRADPLLERGLLVLERHDLGMPLAVLAGKLGLAPQQVGLQRQQVVQKRRAADLAGSGCVASSFDNPAQPREHRLLAGARHGRRHQLGVDAGNVHLLGAQHVATPGLVLRAVAGKRRLRRRQLAFERLELGVEPPALPPRGRVLAAQLARHVQLGQLVGDRGGLGGVGRAPAHGDDVALALALDGEPIDEAGDHVDRRRGRWRRFVGSRAPNAPPPEAPASSGSAGQPEGLDGLARQ